MDQKIKEYIINRLHEIEIEHDIEIVFAVESGSRAWGFESTDSDYDIRFIYRHRESWYLQVLPKRDVIEYPIIDDFDYSGWDLKKTLFLLSKSNPVLFEWLRSPIVYIKNEDFYKKLSEVSGEYFSKISSTYHYLHMAKGNYREYLKKDMVKIKKYFYVIRPILACMWIEEFGESPPMEFEQLLKLIESNTQLHSKITELLKRKKKGLELGLENRIDEINNFIEMKFNYFESIVLEYNKQQKPDEEYLDSIFRYLLNL